MWDSNTGTVIRSFTGHTNWIKAVARKEDIVISAGVDQTIKFWDSNTGSCLQSVIAHSSGVCALTIHHNTLISAGWDKYVSPQ